MSADVVRRAVARIPPDVLGSCKRGIYAAMSAITRVPTSQDERGSYLISVDMCSSSFSGRAAAPAARIRARVRSARSGKAYLCASKQSAIETSVERLTAYSGSCGGSLDALPVAVSQVG